MSTQINYNVFLNCLILASTHVNGCADDTSFNAGTVTKYSADVKWRQHHSEIKNKKAKDKYIEQKYLLAYHHKAKLTSNVVQIILANTRMNEQSCNWKFNFHTVVQQQCKGRPVVNFAAASCTLYLEIQQWKNY